NAAASIEVMKVIVAQFSSLSGFLQVKTCGPGSQRFDTIVAYLTNEVCRNALVQILIDTAKTKPALFTDSLPALVKREAVGIGSADEPPGIEIFNNGCKNYSFGSFFSTVIWIALKNTPQVLSPQADGRHMLDNV